MFLNTLLTAFLLITFTQAQDETIAPRRAICILQQHANSGVSGRLDLEQANCSSTALMISGFISDLSEGEHGFHVHQFGDLSDGCISAGGHFNPHAMDHGAPDDEIRHVGDLGNVVGFGEGEDSPIEISDRQASLCPGVRNNIVGRAIVVHAGRDDLGRGQVPASKRTGDAGSRVACCVVGLKNFG